MVTPTGGVAPTLNHVNQRLSDQSTTTTVPVGYLFAVPATSAAKSANQVLTYPYGAGLPTPSVRLSGRLLVRNQRPALSLVFHQCRHGRQVGNYSIA